MNRNPVNRGADGRIPLVFASQPAAGGEDAVLLEGRGADGTAVAWFEPGPGHRIGCVCCAQRSSAGCALASLYLARGRGHAPLFRRVVAVVTSPAGRSAVLRALEADLLVSAAYRLDASV